jgi:hypothetical protein
MPQGVGPGHRSVRDAVPADRRCIGFVPVPGVLLAAIAGITVLYVVSTELTKRRLSVMRA